MFQDISRFVAHLFVSKEFLHFVVLMVSNAPIHYLDVCLDVHNDMVPIVPIFPVQIRENPNRVCQLIPTDMDHHIPHTCLTSPTISLNHECTDGFIAHIVDDTHLLNATVELTVCRHVASSKWKSLCGLGFRLFLGLHVCFRHLRKILLVCGKLLDVCASGTASVSL